MPPKDFEQKLAELTREFFARHPGVKLVAVTGSTGKTSTKIAIANVLAQQYNLQLREEPPLTRADVFLQIMGVTMPEEGGKSRWKKLLEAVEQRAYAEQSEVQVIVQEFSPQFPGENEWFKQYLLPDITVVASVTEGRMRVEYPVEEVAREMITMANNSKTAMINRDDIEGRFAGYLTNPHITTYGMDPMAEYYFTEHSFELGEGHSGRIFSPENPEGLEVTVNKMGEYNIRPVVVAAAVGYKMGVSEDKIAAGINSMRGVPGRMNVLKGSKGSWLIDDSYSSSPSTALSALQTLYGLDTPQRIAVFGNMNGLRGIHEEEHQKLGSYCNIDMLDWVVTVGGRANLFLAPAARKNGCQVKECIDAIEAGTFVREKMKEGAVVLFKGSSGGVWLEEAVKLNLLNASDSVQLVRQDSAWLEKKQAFFTANRDGDGETINKLGIKEMEDQVDDRYQQTNQSDSRSIPAGVPAINSVLSPSTKKPNNKKKWLVGGIVGGSLIILLTAVLLTYFMWWSNPQKMISDALVNYAASEKSSLAGEFEFRSPDNKLVLTFKSNTVGKNTDFNSKLKIRAENMSSDFEVDAQAVVSEKAVSYFKVSELDKALDVYIQDALDDQRSQVQYEIDEGITEEADVDAYLKEYEEAIRDSLEPLVDKINNKWISVSKDSFDEEGQEAQSCSLELFEKLQNDRAMQEEIARAYMNNQFIIPKEKIESRNGGTGFEIDVTSRESERVLERFIEEFEGTDFYTRYKNCDEETATKELDNFKNSSDETTDMALRLWVHPMSHQFTAIELDYRNAKTDSRMIVSSDINIGEADEVQIPKDATDIKELIESFEGAFNTTTPEAGPENSANAAPAGVTPGSGQI